MNLLAIETSTRRATVAIGEDGVVVAEQVLPQDISCSATLIPCLDNLLEEQGMKSPRIEGIAVGIGPGSFTGIRMGLSTARGLSIALRVPLKGIGIFDLLMSDCSCGAKTVCPIVSAHSYGVYASLFEKSEAEYHCIQEPFVCQPHELPQKVSGDIYFLGPHLSRYRETLAAVFGERASFDKSDVHPRAATAIRLYDSNEAIPDDPPGRLSPIYILSGVKVKSVDRRPC